MDLPVGLTRAGLAIAGHLRAQCPSTDTEEASAWFNPPDHLSSYAIPSARFKSESAFLWTTAMAAPGSMRRTAEA